jgi:hypothetical protein
MGQTVMISNFQNNIKFEYFKSKNGTMYVNNLVDIFDEKYYRHLSGGITFGKLFFRHEGVYIQC